MKRTIPLHVNILTVFTLVICCVVLSVVSYGYVKNSDTAVLSAEQLLEKIGSSIVERTRKIFDTAFMTVDTYVGFPDIGEKASLHSHPMSPAFFKFLSQHPDFTSMYIGFGDGDFFLVSSLRGRENLKKSLGIPTNAVWYTQTIGHRPDGQRYELKKYLDAGYVTVGSHSELGVTYDPRKRGWYQTSIESDVATLSDIYVFAFSDEPGITVSRRFDSDVPGVIGVDLSLANLSRFTQRQLIGEKSEIMIIGASGDIYAYPDIDKLISSINMTAQHPAGLSKIESLQSPVLVSLLNQFGGLEKSGSGGDDLRVDGVSYLSHVDALPKEYGKELFVCVVVPEENFTGPIARIGRQTLFVSVGILALFLPVVFFVAKRISRPLNKLTDAVHDIKAFNLESPVLVKSQIIEIRELEKAMETMRGTLKAFGSYVPKPLVEAMIVNEMVPVLGGERKEMSFLFSDIKGFTNISETLSPEEVTGSITRYLKQMSRVILNNQGTIDKYIGDAIMAFWNAPADDEHHARNACMAALQFRDALAEFNAHCRATGAPEFLTRIGVHTGDAVVGNIGSADRMDYTAMGASVNIASRLEGLNKYLGTDILVSETTVKAAGEEFQFRFAGKVTPKGTSVGLGVYELLGTQHGSDGVYAPYAVPSAMTEWIREWDVAVEMFLSRDFTGAMTAFSACLERHGPDGLIENYLSLAKEYIVRPPDESWRGEQTFNVK